MLLHYCCNYILHTHHFYFASLTALQMQLLTIYYTVYINMEIIVSVIVCFLLSLLPATEDTLE